MVKQKEGPFMGFFVMQHLVASWQKMQMAQHVFLVVMGPGQKFLTRVGSAIYGLVWIGKICPRNVKFFNFLPFRSKKISSGRIGGGLASYLLWVKSKLGSGRVGQGPSLVFRVDL